MADGELPDWEGTIEAITQDGLGVGTQTIQKGNSEFKRPVFIPYTAPGDKIIAKITEKKGKYYFGEIEEILENSEHRTPTKCPHYETCGGCNLQHIEYEEQLRQKARQITYLLERKGIHVPEEVKVWPSRKMHKYRWRSRVAVKFSEEGVCAGFRKRKSSEIVKVNTCFIVAGEIKEFIDLLNNQKGPSKGEIEITVVTGQKHKVGILVHLDETENTEEIKNFFSDLYANNRTLIGNLFFLQNNKVKTVGQVQEHISYPLMDMEFMFLPETFIQANILTNELLVKKTIELLFKGQEAISEATVLDLYAGIGNFSLPLALQAKKVIAIEGQEASVLAGEANALRNGVENVEFVNSSTGKYLNKFNRKNLKADFAVIDPPRTGCSSKVLSALLKSNIRRAAYVSCNPETLANDLRVLNEEYSLIHILGIDMFPDVSHVETIVILERK